MMKSSIALALAAILAPVALAASGEFDYSANGLDWASVAERVGDGRQPQACKGRWGRLASKVKIKANPKKKNLGSPKHEQVLEQRKKALEDANEEMRKLTTHKDAPMGTSPAHALPRMDLLATPPPSVATGGARSACFRRSNSGGSNRHAFWPSSSSAMPRPESGQLASREQVRASREV